MSEIVESGFELGERKPMTNEDYHLRPELGCSMLKTFCYGDRRKFEGYYVKRTESHPDIGGKRQVKIGSLVHQCLLERKDLTELISFYPDWCLKKNGYLNPKPASEFRESEELKGKVVLRDSEYRQVVSSCNAVMGHSLGELIGRKDIEFELPIFWVDPTTGIKCKARPDFMYADSSMIYCMDLKVTESIHPRRWMRQAKRLMYWLQDVHYSTGLSVLHGKPVKFVFWVVESTWPNRIAQFEYDPISRERAGEVYVKEMRDLAKCYETGDFSESWEGVTNVLTLSPWDVDLEEDQELEGFEDEQEDEG